MTLPLLQGVARQCGTLRCHASKGFGEQPAPKKPAPAKKVYMGSVASKQAAEKAQQATMERAPAEASAPPSGPGVDDGVASPQVTDRMLRRVLLFSGVPVLVGLLLFPAFWYLKVIKDIDLPMGTVFVVESLIFGTGLLGISYGATSASWDPAREGSALGWNEFRANFAAIMGKFSQE